MLRRQPSRLSLVVVSAFTLLLLWSVFADSGDLPTDLRRKSRFSFGTNPHHVSPDQPDITHEAAPETHSPIEALWYHSSRLIFNNRPRIKKIKTKSSATNRVVHAKDRNPRNPYEDLVTNSIEDLRSMRASHTGFVKELKDLLRNTTAVFEGHGIAMVGGGEYFGPAITTIQMLRRLGCLLPVELFVKDKHEYEPYVCEEYLPKLGARCLVITDFLDKGAHVFAPTHYQLKVLGLLFSSFQHVLFLDSDSMPLMDPYMNMMLVEPYLGTGMVVWPDFWGSTESPVFYAIAGLPDFPNNLPKTASESGQILINKGTHLPVLLLACYYNIFGPDLYYPLLSQGAMGEGDKETFMAAAVVLSAPYYRVKHSVEAVMNDDGEKSVGRAMLQFHAADEVSIPALKPGTWAPDSALPKIRPAFLHANLPKFNAGHLLDEGLLFSKVDHDKRWRLLGTKEKQTSVFGYDIEATLWEFMLQSGCELADKLNDWRDREDLCFRLNAHFQDLFAPEKEEEILAQEKQKKLLEGQQEEGVSMPDPPPRVETETDDGAVAGPIRRKR
ncbi:hypothetical protein ANO11243_042810 [Dothideomycetidae sp. 11243]|nr:hypothetical protein ANO11243_042810 [fungal sp. No.11243]